METTETDVSHVKPVIDNLPECLTEEEYHTAVDFIERNADVFSRHEYDVGCTNLLTARLLTDPSQPPIAEPLRRYPRCQLNQIDEAVDKLERARIIKKANSLWAANLVVVQRKSEHGQRVAPRITVDFRKLNSVTYRDKYPIPHIKDCLQALDGAAFLSMADVSNGFYQVPLREDDHDKTAFTTRRSQYSLTRLAQGCTNSPAVFCRLMALVLRGLDCCLAYIDDTIVFSPTFKAHVQDLEGAVA